MSDELTAWIDQQRHQLAELETRKTELAQSLAHVPEPLEREERRVSALRAQVQAQRDEVALLEQELSDLRAEASRVAAAVAEEQPL
jgi:chromosome segregation ATPase